MSDLYWCEYAWLGGDTAAPGVLLQVNGDRITDVVAEVAEAPARSAMLRGVTLPGLVNAHSHAFHRALRGRTQLGRGSFWTWREQMYAVAARLTPATYYELARAVYAEMALAGITCVGEFHYLHHDVEGAPYTDPNAMSQALVDAARDAGVRLTLLDTCYLTADVGGTPLTGTQLRFDDHSVTGWAERAEGMAARLAEHAEVRMGAAIHSVRAVPAEALPVVSDWATRHRAPLHVHLSEQRAENDACQSAHGCSPTELLSKVGALGPHTTAVHATHLSPTDIGLLGLSGTGVCMCPTTERDLADGIGPAHELGSAGSPVSLGSDSQAVIDLLEEARGVELDERLASQERGHWSAKELLCAATSSGAGALGWPELGHLASGQLADFSTIGFDSVRTADAVSSSALETAVFAATAADVQSVVVGGRVVVRRGRHALVDDVAGCLRTAVRAVQG